jgi:hypothetical protein
VQLDKLKLTRLAYVGLGVLAYFVSFYLVSWATVAVLTLLVLAYLRTLLKPTEVRCAGRGCTSGRGAGWRRQRRPACAAPPSPALRREGLEAAGCLSPGPPQSAACPLRRRSQRIRAGLGPRRRPSRGLAAPPSGQPRPPAPRRSTPSAAPQSRTPPACAA